MTATSRSEWRTDRSDRDTRVDLRLRLAIERGELPGELLVCGPAGTGKTYGILTILHTLLADYPGIRVLCIRQTRASLTHSVLPTYEEEILPRDSMQYLALGCSRRNRETYRYPHPGGQYSELVLGGLDRPERVLSSSWDVIYCNEAIEIGENGWDVMTSRLDRPGRRGRLGWMIADSNPGDPSHWLKARCDAGRTALWDTTHRANPAMWDQSKDDWSEAGLRYLGRLGTLRGTRRKRYLDGIWAAGEGLWFDSFSAEEHVQPVAYDPALPTHLAIDSGVYTGAVAFQVHPQPDGGPPLITVFHDYLSEGETARANARAIASGLAGRHGTRLKVTSDPAGGARNPVGPTVLSEYAAEGLRAEPWPLGSVSDGLALIECLLDPGGFAPRLRIDPSCKHLVTAFANYRRKQRAGQWLDYPEDPQHPHEDLIDSLRGGLRAEFPGGLSDTRPKFRTKPFSRVFH